MLEIYWTEAEETETVATDSVLSVWRILTVPGLISTALTVPALQETGTPDPMENNIDNINKIPRPKILFYLEGCHEEGL